MNEPKPTEPVKREVIGFIILGFLFFVVGAWSPLLSCLIYEGWIKPTYGKEVDFFPTMLSTFLTIMLCVGSGAFSWIEAYENKIWNRNKGIN